MGDRDGFRWGQHMGRRMLRDSRPPPGEEPPEWIVVVILIGAALFTAWVMWGG